jgi:hypothetical protein
MRTFFSAFWKTIVAILILAAIASFTLDPANAADRLSPWTGQFTLWR